MVFLRLAIGIDQIYVYGFQFFLCSPHAYAHEETFFVEGLFHFFRTCSIHSCFFLFYDHYDFYDAAVQCTISDSNVNVYQPNLQRLS